MDAQRFAARKAKISGNRKDPSRQGRVAAIAGEGLPDANENVLSDFFGRSFVFKHGPGQMKDLAAIAVSKHFNGFALPARGEEFPDVGVHFQI